MGHESEDGGKKGNGALGQDRNHAAPSLRYARAPRPGAERIMR
jgi:hypothetical protein